MIKKSLLKIAVGVFVAQQLHAIPVTLTFDDTYHTKSSGTYRPSYQSEGFNFTSSTVSPTAFGSWGTASPNFAGSMSLFNNYLGKKTALTRIDGGFFNISSIDISELFRSGLSTTINFTGYLNGDAKVSQSFTLDGTFGFQTFLFDPAFSDLKTLEWVTSGNTISYMAQFDNLVLSTPEAILAATSVPEGGSTLIFLGLTFLLVFLLHRKLNTSFQPAPVRVKNRRS